MAKQKAPQPAPRVTAEKLTIYEAAREMHLTTQYVRALIRTNKLASMLEPISADSKVTRHTILRTDIEAFLAGTTRRTKRSDSRNKYVFYATPEERELVEKALRTAHLDDVADMIQTANKLKPRSNGDES